MNCRLFKKTQILPNSNDFIESGEKMQKEENESKNDAEIVSMILTHVNEFGLFSFEREEKREESTIVQAGQMLVALSVFSAVILMLVPILLDYTEMPTEKIFIFLFIILSLLSMCFICAILAQFKYDYYVPADIDQIYQSIYEQYEELSKPNTFLLLRKNQIGELHQSKRKMNNRRIRFLQISLIILILSIFITIFIVLYIYCQ